MGSPAREPEKPNDKGGKPDRYGPRHDMRILKERIERLTRKVSREFRPSCRKKIQLHV